MIRNYFLVAFRNLKRSKVFSLINIGGLSIGLAACWMITLYVAHDLSYDNWNQHAARIYRVAQHGRWPGGSFDLAITPPPMAAALRNDYPSIEQVVRVDAEGGGTITYGEQHLQVGDMIFADPSIFNVFSYHFLYGNRAGALNKPGSIVITETLARKIFGDPSIAVNKVLSFGNNNDGLVTGVIQDIPLNSHFSFSAVRAMPLDAGNNWSNSSLYTYVLLKNAADEKKIKAQLPAFFTKYLKPVSGNGQFELELQPLLSIHLHSNLSYEIGNNGNIGYVRVFSLVALLILIIASINYMNLSTARSSLRVKEIGVRKVSGSPRSQLVLMFLSESVLITVIAAALALLLLQIAMPWFQQFVGKPITVWQFGVWPTIGLITGFSLLAGGLSGLYPALFLSGFKLIPALKGQTGSQSGNLVLRKSLVVFQFVITISMIAGCFIIWQQLKYVNKTDLGFNKEQVFSFHLSRDMRKKIPGIKQQLLKNTLVQSVATASNPIGNNNIGGSGYTAESDGTNIKKENKANRFQIDEDFIPALQIQLLSGRNFSESMPTDKLNTVIVNETLIKDAGWKDIQGKSISMGKDSLGNPIRYQIAGVVKDFNIYSLQHKIEPLILQLPPAVNDKDNMFVRISPTHVQEALAYTQTVLKSYDAATDFEYSFLDQNFARQYESEKTQGQLLMIFTLLAILIACLGLFGLITFTAEQRRKEIGIRKVLGSSIGSIVHLLAKDLMQLVVVAIVIATPIAWLGMHSWLQNFAYHISVHWWTFAIAGVLALLIAFSTVAIQAVKAGLANPVKSLRTE